MQILRHPQIFEIAERGRTQSWPERAVTMLSAAYPEKSWESLTQLCIGERDDMLLALRQQTFGNRLQGLAACPNCAGSLSLELDIDQVRRTEKPRAREFTAAVADYEFRLRLPNSADMIVAVRSSEHSPLALLERCVLEARNAGESVSVGALPETVIEQIPRLIEESDPNAELLLILNCPACAHGWRLAFDIVSFLWHEIIALARQLLVEVHTLAAIYGWSEERILEMSPWRRGMYLAMVS